MICGKKQQQNKNKASTNQKEQINTNGAALSTNSDNNLAAEPWETANFNATRT